MIKIKNTFSSDYTKHVYAGLIITLICGQLSHFFFSPFISGLIGLLMGNIAGFGKEYVWDLWLKKGVFNKQDLFATFWGTLIGTIVNTVIFNIHNWQ